MKIHCVTTFSNDGYKQYAHRMLDSWIEHWPSDITLHVYHDIPAPQWHRQFPKNVKLWAFDNKDLKSFKARNKNNPKQSGNGTNSDYMYDGIRFSHKVFAFGDCCEKHIDFKEQIVIFLDADTITHTPMTANQLADLVKGHLGACLLRPKMYTETGFHMINLDHGDAREFLKYFLDEYRRDTLWDLPAYTDCHAYDRSRERIGAHLFNNLSPTEYEHSHPFANGVCGKWMDHHKGYRKNEGKPRYRDLHQDSPNRHLEYWKQIV